MFSPLSGRTPGPLSRRRAGLWVASKYRPPSHGQSGPQREPLRGSARYMSEDVDVLRALHDVRVLLAPLTRRRDVTLVLTGCDALPRAAVDEQNLGRVLYK